MQTVDTLKNGFKIIQDSNRFKFGIDAILLSRFAFDQIRNNDKVIDLGTGNGIIPLMLAKSRASSITGLEIQSENVELAEQSVKLNQLENKIKIQQGNQSPRQKNLVRSFPLPLSKQLYLFGFNSSLITIFFPFF